MPSNRRIYYAIQSIGFAIDGSNTYIEAHGVQQAGINTTFNLQPIFQLGQLGLYENVELLPEIEFTAEKCLDGYPLLCHLATKGSPNTSLVGRSNISTVAALNVFSDVQYSASGASIAEVNMSGMYWSATTLTFPLEGTASESFTAVGNNKQWRDIAGGASMLFSGFFPGNDMPFALTSGSGGVQRREDMIFYPIGTGPSGFETSTTLDVNGQLAAFLTILPPDIPGISSSGTNDRDINGNFSCHVGDITVSVNLGRDPLTEQGRKGPYFRFVAFPVEVTTAINIMGIKWDNVSALANGLYTTGINAGNNVINRSIRVREREGTFVNLGTSNKLQSVTYGGGDTGGGNVGITYNYVTYNDLTISHPRDPSVLPYPY